MEFPDRSDDVARTIVAELAEYSLNPVVAHDDEFALRTALAALGGYGPEPVRIL